MVLKEDMHAHFGCSTFNGHLCVWLGVCSRSGCQKDIYLEEIGLRVENVSSIINIMIGVGGRTCMIV